VHFAGAGGSLLHGRPGQPVARLRGSRRAIGGTWAWQEAFRQETFLVPRGGVIYLGSDGIGDQGDAARKKFGTPRLLALLSEMDGLPMAEQGRRVADALDAFQGEAEQRDDITLLGIRL
jgi:serine phosphatase RsbU (regulator of sigma subunit)